MDKAIVILLLENLLERIAQHPQTQKWRLGTLSQKEKTALEQAILLLGQTNGVVETQATQDIPHFNNDLQRPNPVAEQEVSSALAATSVAPTPAEDAAPVTLAPCSNLIVTAPVAAISAADNVDVNVDADAAPALTTNTSPFLAFPDLLLSNDDELDEVAEGEASEPGEVTAADTNAENEVQVSAEGNTSSPTSPETLCLQTQSLQQRDVDTRMNLCLDFGTAQSKAFAMDAKEQPIELALGQRAGASGYMVDSCLFITDNGLILFGPQAIAFSMAAVESGRTRFDSPKARLSMGEPGEIDKILVDQSINPCSTPISEGELITLYLGYLTDLAVSELEAQGHSRYTRRRFARPCWSEERNTWAEPLMRRMLAQAQILADTFHQRWQDGILLTEAKQALAQLQALAALPDYLVAQSIPEPIAAAASLILRDEAQREIFMVVDVGAGTTDFGVFFLQHNPDKAICMTRVIPNTIQYVPQAGNRIDELLKFYVLDREGIDPNSAEGKHNKIYLDSRIRLYKEQLFRQGSTEITLANHARVQIQRADFLVSQRVRSFALLLHKKVEEVLHVMGDGYLDLLAQTGLRVVLTGGGASLPMVRALAQGVVEVKGRKILRKTAGSVPEWLEDSYPQFIPQYSQLAVAIGGAAQDLPEQAASFADFKGLSNPTYR